MVTSTTCPRAPASSCSTAAFRRAARAEPLGDILELAERFWCGDVPRQDLLRPTQRREEIADGVLFLHLWANVTALRTADGLVLIDTGNFAIRERTFGAVRAWDERPLAAAIYTHGHVDHACGLPPFLAEAAATGTPRPVIIGHRDVARRFDRYRATVGYNALINARQFGVKPSWPEQYEYPDTVYDTTHVARIGGAVFELIHARGETDDHTWIWLPDRRVLFTGDLIFWSAPNAGNPQKVPRYAAEWAAALRAMATRGAEILVPGHGVPVFGADRVRQVLSDTAEWLEHLVGETLARMNAGATLEAIVREVRPPAHLADRPYLQSVYDEPEYVVRNVWRLYGGWYDGRPAHLKPATEAELGREVSALAGGVAALVARARDRAEAGDLSLACHLIDWAIAAAPEDREAHAIRARIYHARAEGSDALMTRGIFGAAARDSASNAGIELPPLPTLFSPRGT